VPVFRGGVNFRSPAKTPEKGDHYILWSVFSTERIRTLFSDENISYQKIFLSLFSGLPAKQKR
jgi:hypothetical protein